MFHKTFELTSSQMLFGYKSIWFDSKFGEVPMKKCMLNRFCFTERLKYYNQSL